MANQQHMLARSHMAAPAVLTPTAPQCALAAAGTLIHKSVVLTAAHVRLAGWLGAGLRCLCDDRSARQLHPHCPAMLACNRTALLPLMCWLVLGCRRLASDPCLPRAAGWPSPALPPPCPPVLPTSCPAAHPPCSA